jgi:hypothetical protein
MPPVLKFSMQGDEVKKVQQQLNRYNSTRLPRLDEDGDYDVLTMARVMEFQHQKRIGVDGKIGRETRTALDSGAGMAKHGAPPMSPSGKCILVDLVHDPNRIYVYEDGVEKFDISNRPAHGGTRENPTHKGVFQVYKWRRHHTSTVYDDPPDNMAYALYFNGPEAIHSGPSDEASHGCVHVEDDDVAKIFYWAGGKDDPHWKGGSADDTANNSTTGDIRVIVVKQ